MIVKIGKRKYETDTLNQEKKETVKAVPPVIPKKKGVEVKAKERDE
jgi:hypothetical protein